MSELRRDPLSKRWVIIAPKRGERPNDFHSDFTIEAGRQRDAECPFCEGHEAETLPEVYAHRPHGSQANQPGWQVRVAPNKFPALRSAEEFEIQAEGMHQRLNGIGAHEVVIETPQHGLSMADLDAAHLAHVLTAYRQRLQALMQDARVRYVQLFKNHGAGAGASLAHSNAQILTLPVMPGALSTELRSTHEHYRRTGACLFCDIIRQEIASDERIITANESFVAFAPFAGRMPFEMFVAPWFHQHDFTMIGDEQIERLACIIRDSLRRLRAAASDPPYNLVLRTAPNTRSLADPAVSISTVAPAYHWRFEILPRLTPLAGFEFGADCYINPTAPEAAATLLRQSNPG